MSHWPPRISGLSSEFIQFCLRTCDPLWPTAFTVGPTCVLYASGFPVSRSMQAAFDAAKKLLCKHALNSAYIGANWVNQQESYGTACPYLHMWSFAQSSY